MLQFRDLNVDVVSEILRHFVVMDDEGPLILIKVCTEWRDLVAVNPRFWTWITIDERYDGIDAKVRLFSISSGDLPLHITIRRINAVNRFWYVIERCQLLFLEVNRKPWSSPADRDIEGVAVMAGQMLRVIQMPKLESVFWYIDGVQGFFFPTSLREYLEGTPHTNLQSIFKTLPPIMISGFQLKETPNQRVWPSPVPLPKLWTVLRNLPNLVSLEISIDRLSEFLIDDSTVITLPHLNDLTLTALSHSPAIDWRFLSFLRAPAVRFVSLTGTLHGGHIFAGVRELGKSMQPRYLELEILLGQRNIDINHALAATSFQLPRVQYLKISVTPQYEDWPVVRHITEVINSIAKDAHNLRLLDLHLLSDGREYLRWLRPMPCAVRVTTIQPFEYTLQRASRLSQSQKELSNVVFPNKFTDI